MRRLVSACLGSFLLLVTGAAQAAFWVEAISGAAGSCRVVRSGRASDLQVLMLLRDRDRITLAEGCIVDLVGPRNSRTRLTITDSPFEVPAGDAPPSALQNVQDWVVAWYNRQSAQQLSQVSAVARSPTVAVVPVLIEPMSLDRSKLLLGTRSIQVRWTGGKSPYVVTMADASGKVIARGESTAASEPPDGIHLAELDLPELQLANYQIRVEDAQSTDLIRLTVVPPAEEPAMTAVPTAGDVPENIRQSYRAIFLASRQEWRFQALQIAAANDLDTIVQRLVLGDFPEAPPGGPPSGD